MCVHRYIICSGGCYIRVIMYAFLIGCYALAVFGVSASPRQTGTIFVTVTALTGNEGSFNLALCDSENQFLSLKGKCFRQESAEVKNQQAVFVFKDIPFGEYALRGFHDRNSDGKLNTDISGVPAEPYAISKNTSSLKDPLSWEKAKFALDQTEIRLPLIAFSETEKPAVQEKISKEIIKPDNKTRAGKNGINLAIQYYEPEGIAPEDPLLIYIHGDSDGGEVLLQKNKENLLDWVRRMADTSRSVSVFLQRPGFSSEIGKSDGFEGYDTSIYNRVTVKHVTYILGAIESLHEAYPRRPIFIVGHSGGSMTALELMLWYKTPIVKGLVLSAGPMPKAPWGRRHEENRLGNPLDEYVDLPNNLPIFAVNGDKDVDSTAENMLKFVDRMNKKGAKNVKLIVAPGHTHYTVRAGSVELVAAIKEMADLVREK